MVMYCSEHNGHDKALKHVTLNQIEKQRIAGMISAGIEFDEILNRVRDNLSPTEITRLHLLNLKDLNNISRNIRLGKARHKDDAESFRIWVEMCRQEKYKIVRFIKFPGEEGPNASVDGRIGQDDFMMVLMNDMQVYMLQRYGPHRVNCIDSTRRTIGFNFQLTTLMVIDDYGEGFPVAFCISSKVDQIGMKVFLEHVRTAIGHTVAGAVLMTDDSPAYVNSWRSVMGPPDHHILCAWHIDWSWRKNLSKIKHSSEVTSQVYKTLRVVLETDNKEKFHDMLNSLLESMEAVDSMSEFLSYFRHEYASRPEVWAYSYRLGLHCHRSMHLESLQRTLKQVFKQGRKVIKL